MTNREKMLTGAVAAAGVLWFSAQGITRYRDSLERNESLQREAENALTDAQTAEHRGQKARKQLNQWVSQSLPSNRDVAESLYQDWLRTQLTEAGLQVTQLANKSGNARNPQFQEVAFEARATGTMEQLTEFLYRFYSSPHLHRISSATILAEDAGKKLNITATASALILPDVKRMDKLASGEPPKLPKSKDEFRAGLVDRNLFVAYSPKTDPKAASEGTDEIAAGTKFDWATYEDDGWRAVVRIKGSSEPKVYHQGDDVEVGRFKGKIVELDGRRMVVETEKGRVEIRYGQTFSDAVTIDSPPA